MHYLYVLRVERRSPYVVFVGEPGEQVSRARRAVPHVVFVLPVVAEFVGQVLLRELHPPLRREVRAFALAHVLRHEQVAALDDVVPVFALGRAVVTVPEAGVCRLAVVELHGLERHRAGGLALYVVNVAVAAQEHEQLVAQRHVVLAQYVGKVKVGVDEPLFLGYVPFYRYGRLHFLEPLLIYVGEVVFVYAYL